MADYLYLIIGIAVLLVGGARRPGDLHGPSPRAYVDPAGARHDDRGAARRRRRRDAAGHPDADRRGRRPPVGEPVDTLEPTPDAGDAGVDRRPAGPAAPAAGPLAEPARPRPAGPALPRRHRRGHLGGDRGHPDHRRRRRRPHPGAGRAAAHPGQGRGQSRRPRCRTSCARSWSPWSTRAWTARWPWTGTDGKPAVVLWSASTAPARPPRSASSPGCWSPRTSRSCWAPRTRSAPPPPSSWPPGASGSASPAVRGPEGSDPASVAFEAVRTGIEQEADVVLVDTAGRLQNKAGLMDELGKVKRVIEKQAPVTEVLLVLDATTGQNGLPAGPGLPRGRRRDRHRADQARRLRQGRHRGRRPARARACR